MNVRVAALDTLIKIEQGGAYSTIAVNDLLKQKKLATKDVGLYTELVQDPDGMMAQLKPWRDPA